MGNSATAKSKKAADYDLSSKDLQHFLSETLELTEGDVELLESNRMEFLKKLVTAFDCHIPFQNLTHTCVPFAERRTPSLQDNIKSVLCRQGGRCWTQNSVMYVLLKELGYNVLPLMGSVAMPGSNNHMLNMVKDVMTEGDSYIVDVGFSCTAHTPIPLDFTDESPEYNFGYQSLRWVKKEDTYIRQEKLDPTVGPKFPTRDGDWENVIYFDIIERDLTFICNNLQKTMYADSKSKFNVTRRIAGTNSETKKYAVILNESLLVEKDGSLEKSSLDGENDVVNAVAEYFPSFPLDIVRQSYQVWHDSDKA